jgi:hypothetical protein
VVLPFSVPAFVWYAKRELGIRAICYLRLPHADMSAEALRTAVDEIVRQTLPEVAPELKPNPEGFAWADVGGKTKMFLWRSKADGDPILEVRSDADPTRVVAFKSAVVGALLRANRAEAGEVGASDK